MCRLHPYAGLIVLLIFSAGCVSIPTPTSIPANLTSQDQFLMDMIAETYRYDASASMGALVCGAERM